MKIVKLLVQKSIPLRDGVKLTKKGMVCTMNNNTEAASICNYLLQLGDDAELIIEKEDGSREIITGVSLESITPKPAVKMIRFKR